MVLTADQLAEQGHILDNDDRAHRAQWAYEFALANHSNGADTDALQGVVLDSDDGAAMLVFARDIPGADIPVLQGRIEELGDAALLFQFAQEIELANLDAIRDRIVDLEGPIGGSSTSAIYALMDDMLIPQQQHAPTAEESAQGGPTT